MARLAAGPCLGHPKSWPKPAALEGRAIAEPCKPYLPLPGFRTARGGTNLRSHTPLHKPHGALDTLFIRGRHTQISKWVSSQKLRLISAAVRVNMQFQKLRLLPKKKLYQIPKPKNDMFYKLFEERFALEKDADGSGAQLPGPEAVRQLHAKCPAAPPSAPEQSSCPSFATSRGWPAWTATYLHLQSDARLADGPVDAALGTLNSTLALPTNSLSIAYDGNRLILNDLELRQQLPRRPPPQPSPSAWNTRSARASSQWMMAQRGLPALRPAGQRHPRVDPAVQDHAEKRRGRHLRFRLTDLDGNVVRPRSTVVLVVRPISRRKIKLCLEPNPPPQHTRHCIQSDLLTVCTKKRTLSFFYCKRG